MSSNQGILYLNDGQQPGRSNTAITSYRDNYDHYCLSNFYKGDNGKGFTFLDPDIGEVTFPTSEHYLHFQKLTPTGKHIYKDTFKGWTARQVLHENRKIKSEYLKYDDNNLNKPNWSAYNQKRAAIQQQINLSKYQQSHKFSNSIQTAISAGAALGDNQGALQIIEDTSSADYVEDKWGTGPDGKGTNILGNSQTAFANAIMQKWLPIGKNNSDTPSFAAKQHFFCKFVIYPFCV